MAEFETFEARRTQAGTAAREFRGHLEEFYDNLPVAYHTLNTGGIITGVNRIEAEMLGYTKEEMVGKPIFDFVLPEQRAEAQKRFRLKISGQRIPREESRVYLTKGGLKVYVAIGDVLERDSDGRVTGVRTTMVDITASKKAEEALRRSEENYRDLVEKARVAILIDDREGNFKYLNEKYAEIFGYSVEEMKKLGIRSIVHPDDLERVLTYHRRRIENKEAPSRYEFKGMRKDGTTIYLELDTVALKEGKEVIGTRSYMWDITKRKQAEEGLKESEEKYKNLVENISDVIYEVDEKGKLSYIGPNIKSFSGYSPSELIGRALSWFVAPRDRPLIRKKYEGGRRRIGRPIEFRIRTRSHKLIWVRTLSKPIFENKKYRGVRGVLSDINLRKTAEEEILQYQGKLRLLASRMTMVEETERRRIATFLHDQIAQKMALAKIKLESIPTSDLHEENLRAINEVLEFVDESIRDLRSLTFDLSPPILYKLGLAPALEWLSEETQKKYGIIVEFKGTKKPIKINGGLNIILFRSARELLMNVIKHARAKKVKISFLHSRKKVFIQVEDDGIGFDVSVLQARSLESCGFGLFSIQTRLEEFRGQMKIKSEIGAGTRVLLSAPLNGGPKSLSVE